MPISCFQVQHCKVMLWMKISMFLTNNGPDLYALTLSIRPMFSKNNLFQHGSQEYQRIWMKIIDIITSRLLLIFAEISGKLPEILSFRKIYNPTCSRNTKTDWVIITVHWRGQWTQRRRAWLEYGWTVGSSGRWRHRCCWDWTWLTADTDERCLDTELRASKNQLSRRRHHLTGHPSTSMGFYMIAII